MDANALIVEKCVKKVTTGAQTAVSVQNVEKNDLIDMNGTIVVSALYVELREILDIIGIMIVKNAQSVGKLLKILTHGMDVNVPNVERLVMKAMSGMVVNALSVE